MTQNYSSFKVRIRKFNDYKIRSHLLYFVVYRKIQQVFTSPFSESLVNQQCSTL